MDKMLFTMNTTMCFYGLTAVNITLDTDGVLNATGRGYLPQSGKGAGVADPRGGSGGSHGGLGGAGSHAPYAAPAYGRYRSATEYGSGGSFISNYQVCVL